MAEIKIERKKKPVWPWLLLLVIVLLVGWLIYEYALNDRQAFVPRAPSAELALGDCPNTDAPKQTDV